MKKAVLLIYLMFSFAGTCCQGKRLFLEADGFASKLWSHQIIRESQVKDTISGVGFKDNIDSIKRNYGPEPFKKLLEEKCVKINHGAFHYFAHLCKSLHDQSDELDRVKIYELFDHVSQKFWETWGRMQRNKENKVKDGDLCWEQTFTSDWEDSALKDVGSMLERADAFFNNKPLPQLPADSTPPPAWEWFCDVKLLQPIADKLHAYMRTEAKPLTSEAIRSSFTFLGKVDEGQKSNIRKKIHATPDAFQKSFQEIATKMSGERYLTFAVTCMRLYEEIKESQDKIALYILFFSVSKKERDFLKARNAQRRLAEMRADGYPLDPK